MIVRTDENRKQSIVGKTINGFYVSALLLASAVNVLILKTQYGTGLAFDASQVNFKAILKRNGQSHILCNSNLGLLGQYNSLLSGAKNWLVGTDFARPAVAVAHKNVRSVFIALGGHINLKGSDEIEYELNVARNTFNVAQLNVAGCYVDVNPSFSIGVEYGIPSVQSEVIQQGQTGDRFNLGDNVTKIAFLNFEDSDVTKQIIQTLSLSSDRLDQSFNLQDLINRHEMMYGKQPFNQPYQLSVPANVNDGYTPAYPQSFVILNDEEIDRANIDFSFDGALVAASKNYLVYSSFTSSVEILQKAEAQIAKHSAENVGKLPISV